MRLIEHVGAFHFAYGITFVRSLSLNSVLRRNRIHNNNTGHFKGSFPTLLLFQSG